MSQQLKWVDRDGEGRFYYAVTVKPKNLLWSVFWHPRLGLWVSKNGFVVHDPGAMRFATKEQAMDLAQRRHNEILEECEVQV